MVIMSVWDIGYSYNFFNQVFTKENKYNAYVASLLDSTGNETNIVGYIMLELNRAEKHSYIQALYVEPAYRKNGIGTNLINTAEDYSRSMGFKYISASVRDYLFRFYRKFGFSINSKITNWKYFISKNLVREKELDDDVLEL